MATIVTRSAKGVPLTATDHDNNVNNLNTDKVESLSDLSITATSTELNYVDGVTSDIQTQLDSKVSDTGGTLTGNLSLGDNVKAQFGAGNDLQIYHDGSQSIIEDSGTGNLTIKANSLELRKFTNSEKYIYCASNGSVDLYHNGSKKLATTSTGIDVTGSVTIPDGEGYYFGSSTYRVEGKDDGANARIAFITANAEAMRIDSTGKVGIGESAPASNLVVRKDSAGGRGGEITILNTAGTTGAEAALNFGLEASTYSGNNGNAQIKAVLTNGATSATDMVFSGWSGSGFTENMRILSGGGITFNGDTASANALDDYEEGTFNLGVSSGTLASSSKGKYVKIGKMVTIFVQLDGGSEYTNTAAINVTGLPFVSSSPNTTGHAGNGAVSYTANMGSDVISAVVESSYARVFFSKLNSGTQTYANCTGSWAVRFTVSYMVA